MDAFRELLTINKIPPDLANAVLDWLDADQNVRYPDGAEDVDYMQGERAYRAANGFMSSVSELLYIKGFDYNMYAALEPALTVLPVSGTPINVNTAKPLVLRMIVKGLSEQDADSLAKDLAKDPVTDIKDFLSNKLVTGKPVATTGIDVRSGYFMIHAIARVMIWVNGDLMRSFFHLVDNLQKLFWGNCTNTKFFTTFEITDVVRDDIFTIC